MERTFTSIKETCLYVNDLSRTRVFYHETLGLPVISETADRHIFFRAGSSVLLCFNPEYTKQGKELPAHWGKGQLHFAFSTPESDYGRWKAHILEQGIEIEHEEHWDEQYRSFYFRDPDGHCVEIIMDGMWER